MLWKDNAGSPPHMRGKASKFELLSAIDGITPAHAGKSRRTTPATSWQKDHPRTCGEKTKKIP